MTEQLQQEPTALDTAKLIGAGAVVAGGVAAFYLLTGQPIWLRWLIVLAALAVAGLIGLQSQQGKSFSQFVLTARIELRKVVWPSRQETMQVTIVVFAMVIAMGLFFWGLDWVLASLTRWLTGR